MRSSDVQQLKHGLYKVYWKDGGTSLASVGSMSDGSRWIAPCNWINTPPGNEWSGESVWKAVEKVKCLHEA